VSVEAIQHAEPWVETVGAFHAAAAGAWPWSSALKRLAHATGSQSGRLLGISSDNSVRFSLSGDVDTIVENGWFFQGAGRFEGIVASSSSRENCRRDPLYAQILQPSDRPFVFLKTLDTLQDTTICLLATRSALAEQITDAERKVFAALVPQARDAVRVQIALERKIASVLTVAFDALEIPAFIVDKTACVTALTRPAEALVSAGHGLRLHLGRLRVSLPTDAKALADAIDAAATSVDKVAPQPNSVVVRSGDSSSVPLVLDVCALPLPANELRFAPQVMIVAHGARASEARRAVILRTLYDLTAAEANIAEQLAEGKMPLSIAKSRGVAVGTVRGQIRSIKAKIGVNRQIEITARLRQI